MNQEYVEYWKWECWKSGMWSRVEKSQEYIMLKDAVLFTSDHIKYGNAMRSVVSKWDNTMRNHLTNNSINRKAFLGHCAVYYQIQIPEYIVRMAWKQLTEQQRILANNEAENTIKEWERTRRLNNMSKHGKEGATRTAYQMKLQLN